MSVAKGAGAGNPELRDPAAVPIVFGVTGNWTEPAGRWLGPELRAAVEDLAHAPNNQKHATFVRILCGNEDLRKAIETLAGKVLGDQLEEVTLVWSEKMDPDIADAIVASRALVVFELDAQTEGRGDPQSVQVKVSGHLGDSDLQQKLDAALGATPSFLDTGAVGEVIRTPERYADGADPRRIVNRMRVGDIARCLRQYNADLAGAPLTQRQADPLVKGVLVGSGTTDPWLRDLDPLRGIYAGANALAMRLQKLARRTLKVVCVCVGVGAFLFGVWTHLVPPEESWIVFGAYVAFFCAATVAYLWAGRNNVMNRFLDYRGLAEGLRVQFYWRVCGLADCVADQYLRRQKSELDWIRLALASAASKAPRVHPGRFSDVGREWIEVQRNYFAKQQREKSEVRDRWNSFGDALIASSFALAGLIGFHVLGSGFWRFASVLSAMAIITLLWTWHHHPQGSKALGWRPAGIIRSFREWWRSRPSPKADEQPSVWIELRNLLLVNAGTTVLVSTSLLTLCDLTGWLDAHGLGIVLVELLAVVGGLMRWYVDRSVWGEEADQYAAMLSIYRQAAAELASVPDPPQKEVLIRELGREALAESADWVLMHRKRPIELPEA